MHTTMAKKTKIAGIMDQSSFGFTLEARDCEIEISQDTRVKLVKMIKGSEWFKGDVGYSGNNEFYLEDTKEETTYCKYQFKQQGNRTFLNATGNPSKLISGRSDIPSMIYGEENAVLGTFKLSTRILFYVLEHVPSDKPFKWTKTDRKNIEEGGISVTQLQVAYYSGDLGDERDKVLMYYRLLFGGIVFETTENLAELLNVSQKNWDGNYNSTLVAKSYNHIDFTLCFYAKDLEPNYDGENSHRVSSRIRYDCTFHNKFLANNKIKTVADLEKVFVEKCEKGGYDVGFIRWLADYISNRLYLEYLTNLTPDSYNASLHDIERKLEDSQEDETNLTKALRLWYETDKAFRTKKEFADNCKVPEVKISKVMNKILEDYGINVMIPKKYHASVLANQMLAATSWRDLEDWVRGLNGNRLPNRDELVEKAKKKTKKMKQLLFGESSLAITKFNPIRVKADNLYIYKRFLKG